MEVGHNPAQTIINSAQKLNCDLIIMGWKGFTTTAEKILGEVADNVVSNAQTDLMLVKLIAGSRLENWLLPTAGGKHAICAEQYAASIVRANGGSLTVCNVVSPKAGESVIEGANEILDEAVSRISSKNGISVDKAIIKNSSINQGILGVSKSYDAIMLGATEHHFKKRLFGSIPEVIAKESLKTVVLVKKKG
ncbi:MAG: universal stress protein [Pyrinomonadaceae bacterium]